MDYQRVYREFIADRRPREGSLAVYETHHILPRCLKGGDEPANLIRLSLQDHLFAHALLARVHGGLLLVSFCRMLGMKKYAGRRSRAQFEQLRSARRLEMLGNKQGELNRGVPKTEEHRRRIGLAAKGKKLPALVIEKIRLAHQGKSLTAEHREKIGLGCRGKSARKSWSQEQRAEIGRQSSARIAAAKAAGTYVPPALGLRHSEETRRVIGERSRKNALLRREAKKAVELTTQ